ncbi:MAG: SH3 domain-containing protein, partial [Planctomycetes bacterium]|nr:SH3 domain-containing protein [Planctomycetota bacterium]
MSTRTTARTRLWLAAAFAVAVGANFLPAAGGQDKVTFPCEVEVSASNLNLRAGIGQAYVILHTAKKGDTFVALEEQLGWYRVKPPAGLHIYLAKEFVDAQGAGQGVVKGDRVNARPTADTKHPPVCQIAKGTSVRIVAEVNGWYKIPAPSNTSCWAKKDFVKFLRAYNGPLGGQDGS